MSLRLRSVLLLLVLCAGIFAEEPGEVFQVSTYDALSLGISMSFSELRRHGDFGLGTFDALDGEMIAIDGSFLQVRSDGVVVRVENDMTTPFAMVTDFKPNLSIAVRGPSTRSQVLAAIDQMLPSANYFYALKIQGQFISVTARSVPRQLQPYPTLTDAIAQQSIFPLRDIRGTLVGFRSPAFVKGINLPGYHFHFLSDDQSSGGHALDFEIGDAIVEIETVRKHSTFCRITSHSGLRLCHCSKSAALDENLPRRRSTRTHGPVERSVSSRTAW